MKGALVALPLWALLCGGGCAAVAAEATLAVSLRALPALEQEGDYALAEAAVPAHLKLLEGLRGVLPGSGQLLELLTRGFGSYAFAFVEERAEEARAAGDDEGYAALVERALRLYERAGRYGLELLGLRRGFDDAWKAGGGALDQKLVEFDRGEVGRLFWTAYAWLGALHLRQDKVENLALLPRVLKLAERALVLDEAYYHGGVHVLLGGLRLALPRPLGGQREEGRRHFEKVLALTGGRSLLAKVLYARHYAVGAGERTLFERLLREVRDAPDELLPEARLQSVLAKRKAARLLQSVEVLF